MDLNTDYQENYEGFVEQDTALESMRASDFDCYSAYGEVIDNSIQAFATDIRIKFEERSNRAGKRSKKISRVLFADNGTVTEKIVISAKGPNYAIEIPGNTWHTLMSLQSHSVLFEVKKGPYIPVSDKHFASWAPQENSPTVVPFIDWLSQAKVGDLVPSEFQNSDS